MKLSMLARFLNESKIFSMQNPKSNIKKIMKKFHIDDFEIEDIDTLPDGKPSVFSLLMDDDLLIYTIPAGKSANTIILCKDKEFSMIASIALNPSVARNCVMQFSKLGNDMESFLKLLKKFKFNTMSLHLGIFKQKWEAKHLNESTKLMSNSDFASDFMKFYEKSGLKLKIPNDVLTDDSPGLYCIGFCGNIIAYSDSSVTNSVNVYASIPGKLDKESSCLLGVFSSDNVKEIRTIMVSISKVVDNPPKLRKLMSGKGFKFMMNSNWNKVLYQYSRFVSDFTTRNKIMKGK